MPECKRHYVYYTGVCLDCYAMECEQIRKDIAKLTAERDARRISQALAPAAGTDHTFPRASTPKPMSLGQQYHDWCVQDAGVGHLRSLDWDRLSSVEHQYWEHEAQQQIDLANATGQYAPWMPATASVPTTPAQSQDDDDCAIAWAMGGFGLPHTD